MQNMLYRRSSEEAINRMIREFGSIGFRLYTVDRSRNLVRIEATMPIDEWGKRYGEKRIITLGNMCEVGVYY